MIETAVYPGSFDPITNGHIDLIKRSLKIFRKLTIAILINPSKKPLFSIDERKEIIKELFKNEDRIQIDSFDGLLIDYMNDNNLKVLIRGLRAVTDFEHEFQMALTNRKLSPEVETFFMVPSIKYTFLNSTVIKEIYKFGGTSPSLVPPIVEKYLWKKFEK